jgi:hypothetical protein
MCLLIESHASTVLPEAMLASVYRKNSDGIGVMWAENGFLRIEKALPANVGEFLDFYERNIKGKECFWHARWRTHGAINLDNCHPYTVFDQTQPMPVALMHNGVLRQGNEADTSMSDTWHYINDFLKPTTQAQPAVIFVPEFAKIIAAHIGSNNKFALMNNLGQMQVVNREAGVTYNGAWLSNTYAWDSATYMPPPARTWTPQQTRIAFTAPPPSPKVHTGKGKRKVVKAANNAVGPRLTDAQQDAIDQQGDLIKVDPNFGSQTMLAKLERLNLDLGDVAAWECVKAVGVDITSQQMYDILMNSANYKTLMPRARRDLPMDVEQGNRMARLVGLDLNRGD